MGSFLARLFYSDFMPHGDCYLWRPEIIWLHAASDSVIALSYYLIPLMLLYFVRQRRDLPFNWMFVMFGVFIFGCGTTHLMEVWTLWHGTYRLAGVIKALTALASLITAGLLFLLLPQALALPSPAQLRAANAALAKEINERRRAEEELQAARTELESRVQLRTAELARANEVLRGEIRERLHAEEALQNAQAALAHVTRVTTMGELAASIAHEVNQPLAAIVTNGSASLRWLAPTIPNLEEARAAITRMIREANRASDVIKEIRQFVKKGPPQQTLVKPKDLIEETIALIRREIIRNEVTLRTDLAADLPLVLADRVQLQQVLLNLIINGLDAMKPVAGRPRHLAIMAQRDDSSGVMVQVQDCGVGIDPQNLERVFDAFFTTKAEGIGMGLSISRSIVSAHGGRLWAAPNPHYGATFSFTIPTQFQDAI